MRASDGSALAIRRFAVRPRPTTRLTTFVKRVVCPCRGKRVQHSHSGGKRVTIHCCDRRACSRVSNVSSNSPFTVKLFISYEHENRSFSICLWIQDQLSIYASFVFFRLINKTKAKYGNEFSIAFRKLRISNYRCILRIKISCSHPLCFNRGIERHHVIIPQF